MFNGHTLRLSEGAGQDPSTSAPKAGGMFVPRRAGARPKAGLGFAKSGTKPKGPSGTTAEGSGKAGGAEKGQDDFRKMLMGGK